MHRVDGGKRTADKGKIVRGLRRRRRVQRECTAIGNGGRALARSHGNFANPRDTKRECSHIWPALMRRRISVYVGRRCGDGKSRLPGSQRARESERERESREREGRADRKRAGERARGSGTERGWFGRRGAREERERVRGETERVDNDPADTNSNQPPF